MTDKSIHDVFHRFFMKYYFKNYSYAENTCTVILLYLSYKQASFISSYFYQYNIGSLCGKKVIYNKVACKC